MKKIGVIGLGNPLRHDDGLGIALLELARKHKEDFLEHIEFIDGGTGGMNLLHLLARFDTVLLIDAVLFNGQPGETRFFYKDELLVKTPPMKMSTHEIDLIHILHLSMQLNELPSQLFLFGIQPKDLSHGIDLSPELKSTLPQIYKKLALKIKTLNQDA
jgi:hydrogenase maturation protease